VFGVMNAGENHRGEEDPDIIFRRYNANEARQLREIVERIYLHSYVDALFDDNSFDSTDAFMCRFDVYASHPDFDLVVAYKAEEAIGQAWGWPLTERSRWWDGLLAEPEPDYTHETGDRTFALSEIMVCQRHTGKGVAHALHDKLLSARRESRATLLVRPDNTKAYRAYQRWGWQKVAQLRPAWEGAPTFDVLILELGGSE
jgi:GNAT superfamily N-acetyltransferase